MKNGNGGGSGVIIVPEDFPIEQAWTHLSLGRKMPSLLRDVLEDWTPPREIFQATIKKVIAMDCDAMQRLRALNAGNILIALLHLSRKSKLPEFAGRIFVAGEPWGTDPKTEAPLWLGLQVQEEEGRFPVRLLSNLKDTKGLHAFTLV